MAHVIIFFMHMLKYLWGDAILIASYLINRMPTCILKYITPLDYFKRTFPTCRINSNVPLNVFGCTVFVHIPNKFRSKLDPRAEKCVFIGYVPNKKG